MPPQPLIAGRYLLHERLGNGGMGVVWRAEDTELGRTVAIKQATSAGAGLAAKEIRREARMAAGVHHPGVVTLFDVVVQDDECWLVMEYLPASSLAEILEERGSLPVSDVVTIGAQLATALHAVHEAGVLHRDIKPGNVLITQDWTAKLTDFGISRPVWGDVTATDSAVIGGTPAFLSPEVAGGLDATTASDVFSLGATLFTAVEGSPPFGRTDNPFALIRRVSSGDVRSPRSAGALTPVLEAMLDPDPSRRPDAATVGESLAELAAGMPTDPSRPMPEVRRPRPASSAHTPTQARKRRRRAALFTAAGVAVVAAVALIVVLREVGNGGAAPAKPAASLIGDPRTVDPCALVDPQPLSKYGDTSLEPEYGNFDRCDVLVDPTENSEVDVMVDLNNVDAGPVPKQLEVQREPREDNECGRTIRLPEPHELYISADQDPEEPPADLCAMAETATQTALAALRNGPLPRRTPPDPNALLRTHACALLDARALSRIPGVDANHPDPGFGDWDCEWESTTSDLSVELRFDRNNEEYSAADGRPVQLAGRQAFVIPEDEGEGTCVTVLTHRVYRSDYADRPVELVRVLAAGPQPVPRLCNLTTALARDAARRLPPARNG